MSSLLISARWLIPLPERVVADGGLWIERGRVRAVVEGRRALARARASAGVKLIDLGEHVLTPGLVNAHAHLELTGFERSTEPGDSFASWIEALVSLRRAASASQLGEAIVRGADLLVSSGTTTVGDIDSGGGAATLLASHPIRAVVYREALDAGDPARAAAALARLAERPPRRLRTLEGLSPHAPYTVGRELFRALGELARRRRLPVSVHWAESREETRWLERGDGPFARILAASPRRSGLELVGEGGWLDPARRTAPLSLVHGNHPAPGDVERVARARAVVVHCPGSHRFFGRERFDAERWRAAGVELALGTDSRASNARLDMTREMALFRSEHPRADPADVWAMATRAGASALGLAGRVGELAPGCWADACAWRIATRRADELLDALTCGAAALERTWIAGRALRPAAGERER